MAAVHPETNFAANLIQYILRSHGRDWAPDPEHLRDGNSPYFTRMVEGSIDSFFRTQRASLLAEFNTKFPNLDSDLTEEQFMEAINSIKIRQFQNGFHTDSFLGFCCLVAEYAGLAVARRFQDAPNRAFTLIIQAVQEERQLGRLVNYFWNDIQNAALTIDALRSS